MPNLVGQNGGASFATSRQQNYSSTAGNALVLWIAHQTDDVTSVTDTAGNTWVLAKTNLDDSAVGEAVCSIYYVIGADAITSVTVQVGATNRSIHTRISEWTGVGSLRDAASIYNSSFSSPTCSAPVAAQPGDLVVSGTAYFTPDATDDVTEPTGFTSWGPLNISTVWSEAGYRLDPPADPEPASWTFSPGRRNGGVTVSFSEAVIEKTVTDDLGITDTVSSAVDRDRSTADDIGITDTVSSAADRDRFTTDDVGITDTVVSADGRIRITDDPVGITDTVESSFSRSREITDTVGLTDTLVTALGTGIIDEVGISDTVEMTVSRSREVIDPVGISDTVDVSFSRSREIIDSVGITDDTTSGEVFCGSPVTPFGPGQQVASFGPGQQVASFGPGQQVALFGPGQQVALFPCPPFN